MIMNYRRFILCSFLLLAFSNSFAEDSAGALNTEIIHANHANGGYESSLLSVVNLIEQQDLSSALNRIDDHLKTYPHSREGHLLRADILQSKAGALSGLGGNGLIDESDLSKFQHQLKTRLKHSLLNDGSKHALFPSSLIETGAHNHVLVADLGSGRMYLYKTVNGSVTLLRDYYMSIGSSGFGKEFEGDNRTPVGVYEINRHIEGKALPDLYGKGAFPVNYPNRYDRSLKRTGYGIWLHGTPSTTYARSPWSSEGCFVLSNDDLLDIAKYISVEDRTPVILSDSIEWLNAEQLQAKRALYLSVIDQWKNDWESLDVNAYTDHYSVDNFNLGKGGYGEWAKRKQSVNVQKTFVQLDIELKSLFVYPGNKDMFVVKYRQRYLSNNYSGEVDKEQYWQKDSDGAWKIIYEG